MAQRRLWEIRNFTVLEVDYKTQELAKLLISEKAVPEKCPEDVVHIAVAAVHNVEFIVTWNFKHINNPFMWRKSIVLLQKAVTQCLLSVHQKSSWRRKMNDPIVEEVRKHRNEHARKFDYNIDLICKDLRDRHTKNMQLLKQMQSTNLRMHRMANR